MNSHKLTDLLSEAFDEAVYTPPEESCETFDTGEIYNDMDLIEYPTPPDETPHPQRQRHPSNQWDPRLVLDLAVGLDEIPEILLRYGLSEHEFNILTSMPVFRKELAMAMKEVRESGASFACKARFQAESYLEVMDELVYSSATPASTRLETIRSAVKWGRLEPKEEKTDGASGATVNVQINF